MKLITGIVAKLGRGATPGCRARLATRPLAGARWTQPSRVVFRTAQVGFGLDDLRLGPAAFPWRSASKEFAFKIAEVALRLLEVSPLFQPRLRRAP